jgi:hypothetical protein
LEDPVHIEHEVALLIASLLALAVGPLLYHTMQRSKLALLGLHAAIVIAIFALIVLHILPECVESAGWLALIAAGAGLLGPVLAEGRLREASARAPGIALCLALAALLLHEFTDGMALAGGHEHAHDAHVTQGLALAVVLHRVLEGAALWWLLRPRGPLLSALALALVAGATIAGFALGGQVLPGMDAVSVALFQAFVGGVMLHVLLHRHREARTAGDG